MTDSRKITSLKDLHEIKRLGMDKLYPQKTKICVGMASCGLAAGAGKIFSALEKEINDRNADIILASSGCIGFCQVEPLVVVHKPGKPKIIYSSIAPKRIDEFVSAIVSGEERPEWALCRVDAEELIVDNTAKRLSQNGNNTDLQALPLYQEIPFFKPQQKIGSSIIG